MDKYISKSVNREQQKSDIVMREVKEIIDEKDKEIGRLMEEKEREAKRNYLEIALNVKLIDERDILKKEREWLFDKLIDLYQRRTTTDMPEEEMKEILEEIMQQALKEK